MNDDSTPTIPGRCGIHLFTDLERARSRTCDVCQEAVAFALETTKAPKIARHWSEEHRAKMATVMDAQKRQMQGVIRAHTGERTHRTQAGKRAEEATSKQRDEAGRFVPPKLVPDEPSCVACQGSDGAIHSCGRYYRGALGNGDNGFAETG